MKLTSISKVKLDSPKSVYDIEVDHENHNFCLSNGVVVHNSKDTTDAAFGALYTCFRDQEEAFAQVDREVVDTVNTVIKDFAKKNQDRFKYLRF